MSGYAAGVSVIKPMAFVRKGLIHMAPVDECGWVASASMNLREMFFSVKENNLYLEYIEHNADLLVW